MTPRERAREHDAPVSSEIGDVRVLVVTKMWPTRDAFRNGFLERQVNAVEALGVDCEVMVVRDDRSGPWSYLKAASAVRRRVASGRYDVVHAHYGLTGASCLLQGAPLVVTLHGSDINGSVGATGERTLKGVLEATISRAVARRADVVIAVSERMVRLIPTQPVIVPVGIDIDLFRPVDRAVARRQLGLDQSRRYVLFAANPDNPVKRHWLAEQAVSIAQARCPEIELLTVCGEPLDRMPLWMSAADVLAITSVYEGGPMVHREAMACNLPVVSVDVGDVALHLADVVPSAIVDADAPALAAALGKVLGSGIRSNGRLRMEQAGTDAASTAEAIRDVYRKALARTTA